MPFEWFRALGLIGLYRCAGLMVFVQCSDSFLRLHLGLLWGLFGHTWSGLGQKGQEREPKILSNPQPERANDPKPVALTL